VRSCGSRTERCRRDRNDRWPLANETGTECFDNRFGDLDTTAFAAAT
jgi:hypothetical protein